MSAGMRLAGNSKIKIFGENSIVYFVPAPYIINFIQGIHFPGSHGQIFCG